MSTIQSRHNSSGKEADSNRKYNELLSKTLREKILQSSKGGRPEMVRRHQERGKLLARDRIEELVDPDTPFLEFSPLAAYGLYGDEVPSAGIVPSATAATVMAPEGSTSSFSKCNSDLTEFRIDSSETSLISST